MFTPKDSISAPIIPTAKLPAEEHAAANDLSQALQVFYDQPNQYYYSLDLFQFSKWRVLEILKGNVSKAGAEKGPSFKGWMHIGVEHGAIKARDFCTALFVVNKERKKCPSVDRLIPGKEINAIIDRVTSWFPKEQTKGSRDAAAHTADMSNTIGRNAVKDNDGSMFMSSMIENDTLVSTVDGKEVRHRLCEENLGFMREVVSDVNALITGAISQMK